VATYWDGQQGRCLPCSSGCLSCSSCYACTSCQPGFYLDFASSLCLEVCGDAKRFTSACDDGNNVNGDGCSSDCKVEVGFSCAGGSPNSKDSCSKTLPQALKFTSTGQSHLWGKIVLNVQANYLPLALVQSASDCANGCNNVLSVKIVSGDSAATSIVAAYIPTTSYSFSIEVNFEREPIGLFSLQVGINPNLVQKYFSGINVSNSLTVNVNPAFLSLAEDSQQDIALDNSSP
jgi:cysteine-rich repeat protein